MLVNIQLCDNMDVNMKPNKIPVILNSDFTIQVKGCLWVQLPLTESLLATIMSLEFSGNWI